MPSAPSLGRERQPIISDPAAIVGSAATLLSGFGRTSAAVVRDGIDAMAAAGFAGMSIWTSQHDWAVADGMTSAEFVGYHNSRGLGIPTAEVLILDWATTGLAEIERAHGCVLDVCQRVGSRYVIAVVLDPSPPPRVDSDAGLGHICDMAAARGLAVSFEFLPWSGVANIGSALQLLETVDRENLGIVLDTWHWFRQPGGPAVSALRSLPADRIHILQMSDAPAVPSGELAVETHHRLLPGEGAIDILGLLDVLADMEARPVVVSEVFSKRLTDLGARENARLQFEATKRIMEQHTTRATTAPGAT